MGWDNLVPQAASIEGWGGGTYRALVVLGHGSGLISPLGQLAPHSIPVHCMYVTYVLSL